MQIIRLHRYFLCLCCLCPLDEESHKNIRRVSHRGINTWRTYARCVIERKGAWADLELIQTGVMSIVIILHHHHHWRIMHPVNYSKRCLRVPNCTNNQSFYGRILSITFRALVKKLDGNCSKTISSCYEASKKAAYGIQQGFRFFFQCWVERGKTTKLNRSTVVAREKREQKSCMNISWINRVCFSEQHSNEHNSHEWENRCNRHPCRVFHCASVCIRRFLCIVCVCLCST